MPFGLGLFAVSTQLFTLTHTCLLQAYAIDRKAIVKLYFEVDNFPAQNTEKAFLSKSSIQPFSSAY